MLFFVLTQLKLNFVIYLSNLSAFYLHQVEVYQKENVTKYKN